MARWNAWECRSGRPGTAGPDRMSASPGSAFAATLVNAPSTIVNRTPSRQPSGNRARGANSCIECKVWRSLVRGKQGWPMAWRVIRAADLVPSPWPNGRGITRDYATHEVGGVLRWKVTLAELTEDAPFSVMPFERVFTVVAGAVELTIDGAARRCEALEPVRFSGRSTTSCRLLTGPAQAFNLMHDPLVAADVARLADAALGAGEHIVWSASGGTAVAGFTLGPGDAAAGAGPGRVGGQALVVSIA